MLSHFKIPLIFSALTIAIVFFVAGLQAAITVSILALLELTFSFDNAIVNAKILARMSPYWQKLFLTVGIIIAVFGMRLLFPVIIVSLSAHINPVEAVRLALHDPSRYAHLVSGAHAAIAAFGGIFLLMLFLDWLFEEREIRWIKALEQPFGHDSLTWPIAITANVIIWGAMLLGHHDTVAIAGTVGLLTYLGVRSLDKVFNEDKIMATASAGLATFLYLEVLDASFSFDGVIGAFAVTNEILLIAAGLGIGAFFIRSLTVYLTNKGTLNDYRYLEHGAHWAIGTLAVLLLLTIRFEINDIITGLLGVSIISVAFYCSVKENRH